jgi:hypothetical protein
MTEEGRTIKTYGQAPLCRGTGPSGRRASSASKRRSRNGFRAVSLRRHLTAFFLLFCAAAVTGAAPAPGSIDVLYEGGSREIEFRLTTASGMLRIEQVSPSSSPAPIHLVDLTSGDVTIVNRFNRTVLTHAQTASAEPEDEHPDPRGSSATTPPDPAEFFGGTPTARLPMGVPPVPLPFAPGMAQAPTSLPDAFAMQGRKDATPQLQAHEDYREIHGYRCQRHTLRIGRFQELTLWLTEHPDLPPFHLLQGNYTPRFGPTNPFEEWPRIVRRSGKFAMLAQLREIAAGAPRVSAPASDADPVEQPVMAQWAVVAITPAKPDLALFTIPDDYLRLPH